MEVCKFPKNARLVAVLFGKAGGKANLLRSLGAWESKEDVPAEAGSFIGPPLKSGIAVHKPSRTRRGEVL